MKRFRHVLILVILTAATTACVTPPYDPFVLDRAQIYERVDTLVMMPLQSPEFERKDEVSTRYEALITERLEAAGFNVISSKESSSIVDARIEAMGGIFDPKTGRVDEGKQKAVNEHLAKELSTRYAFDAFIVPRIDMVKANWTGNTASWDGVTDATSGKTGFWASFRNSNLSGTIPAISLIVVLKDKTDSESYYVGRGGIHLVARYGETFASGFQDIPLSEWFVDEERDVTAVSIALSALVDEPEPET